MKQMLILSGKGGTGKTTIASAFITLAAVKAYADCDVDAPNLHLIMARNKNQHLNPYYGLPKAFIETEKCIVCGLCRRKCRFNAIKLINKQYLVDDFSCEGCSVCQYVCPVQAIVMRPAVAGKLMLYQAEDVFSTAELKMGSGTSGMLVSAVKKQLIENCSPKIELAIIDGSPGIGCPVVASLSGVDMVLIVAETTLSGISDMKRIIKTAQQFKIKIAVCINKFDVNIENTTAIEQVCEEFKVFFVGKIPFDYEAVKITNDGKSLVEVDCVAGKKIAEIYKKCYDILQLEG